MTSLAGLIGILSKQCYICHILWFVTIKQAYQQLITVSCAWIMENGYVNFSFGAYNVTFNGMTKAKLIPTILLEMI